MPGETKNTRQATLSQHKVSGLSGVSRSEAHAFTDEGIEGEIAGYGQLVPYKVKLSELWRTYTLQRTLYPRNSSFEALQSRPGKSCKSSSSGKF